MLVKLTIEGRNVNTLVDSGSQVNTITPALVQQYGFPVLPLEDLMDYPLNLVGLGRKCTSLLGDIWTNLAPDELTNGVPEFGTLQDYIRILISYGVTWCLEV